MYDFDGWDSIDLIDAVLALLVEPLLGYPEQYEKLMGELEAPYEGTAESKRKAQEDLLAQFGMSLDTVAQGTGKVTTHRRGDPDTAPKKKRRRTARPFGSDDK